MKLLIASDIHGSSFYCKKLLEKYNDEKPDKLVLLGDILYHGPRNDLPRDYAPKDVIKMLNPLAKSVLCVRGNCDTEVDQMVLDFPVLADYSVIFDGKITMYLTHGHHIDNIKCTPKDFVVAGHTHIPACEKRDGYTYINPGSVSIPKEDSHHGYIIYENGTFVWKDFDGNIIKQISTL